MKKRHGVSGPLRIVPCMSRVPPVCRHDADGGQTKARRDRPREERRQCATLVDEERVGALQLAIHRGAYLPRPYHVAMRLIGFAAGLATRDDPAAAAPRPSPCPAAALLDWVDHVLDGKH